MGWLRKLSGSLSTTFDFVTLGSVMFTIQQHEQLPLKKWFSLRGSIDFDPPYQRKDNIWPTPDTGIFD